MNKKDQHWYTTEFTKTVSFVSDGCVPEILDENKHTALYLLVGDYSKLGVVEKVHNMTPIGAFQKRYAGAGSSHLDSTRYKVPRLYVCDRNAVNGTLDKAIHKQVNKEYKNGNCPFYCPKDNANLNYEGFVNFDSNNSEHFDILEKIIEKVVKQKPSDLSEFKFRNKSQENDFNSVLWVLNNSSLPTRKKYFRRLKEDLAESGKWSSAMVRFQYNVLWQAMCGSGKTTLSPKLITELSEIGDVCLFLTPIVDTMDSFTDNCETKFYGKPIKALKASDFENKTKKQSLDLIKEYAKTHVVVICLSVQDMRYEDGNGQIREKYSFLESLDLNVLIRDEAHMHYNAEKTAKKMGLLNVKYLIDLTATTYKLLDRYGNIYSSENILDRDIFYCMLQKKNGNKDYALIPNMEYHIADILSDDPEIAALREKHNIAEKDNFSSDKLWLAVDGGKAFYSNAMLLEVMRFVSNGSSTLFRKNHISYSSYSDVGSSSDTPWIKHIIPEAGKEQGCQAKDKIDLAVNLLNQDPKSNTLYISADEFLKIRSIEGPIKVIEYFNRKAISLGKKYVAIITHRQLLVGSDIVPSCFTYVWDNITSPDLLEQIQGRDVRIWTKTDEDGNLVNLKPTSRIFFMNQGMKLALPYLIKQCAQDKIKNNPEYKGKERELCGCVNVVEYLNTGKTRQLSYEDILSRFNEHRKRQLVAGGMATYSQFNIPELVEWFITHRRMNENIGALINTTNKPRIDVTQKNGAETYEKDNVQLRESDTDKNKYSEDTDEKRTAAEDIRAVCEVISSLPMAYIASGKKIKNVMDAIEHPIVVESVNKSPAFKKTSILQVVSKMFEEVPEAKSLANDYFKESAKEIDVIPSELLPESKFFYNVDFIKRAGTVYIPREFVKSELVAALNSTDYKPEGAVVINALNGVIPVHVKKQFPDIPIRCIETDEFPHFVNHLTSMGYETYLYQDNSWKNNPMKDLNGKEIDKSKITVIMNPPYTDNVDLQFITEAMKIANRIIVVHPAVSTVSRFDKKFDEYKKSVDGHVKSIKLFNGNPIFNIMLHHPCQIVEINMDETYESIDVEYSFNGESKKYKFSSMFDINIWGNIPEYFSLEKKISKYCSEIDNCNNHGNPNKKTKHSVPVAKVRGNVDSEKMFNSDYYTFLSKNKKTKKPHYTFYFDSAVEAANFEKYLKSDFTRFCLSILKTKAHIVGIQWKGIPYLPSYETPWTEERLTELFDITNAEWAFIKKVIPKYY